MRAFHRTALVFAAFIVLVLFPHGACADTLYLSPSDGTFGVGKTISVQVLVSSPAQAINAVSAALNFPADKLQVVSILKTSSILSLWVSEPTFSNTEGKVEFQGIVPNPGFTGRAGTLVAVSFKVLAPGAAAIKFTSGSILANDGQGTNILKTLVPANLVLGGALVDEPAPLPVQPSDSKLPAAPIITSDTFLDQRMWYTENSGAFRWQVGQDITASKVLVDRHASSLPVSVDSPALPEYTVKSVADGIWYVHVQLKNAFGWGPIGHYTFKVDTTNPTSFTIRELKRDDKTDPRARFAFMAADGVSGISHYLVQVDSQPPEKWMDDGSGIYETGAITPGTHTLSAKAYDEAGNFTAAAVDFEIDPLPPPTITSYTDHVKEGEPIIVKGTALADQKVRLVLMRGAGDPVYAIPDDEDVFIRSVGVDGNGSFTGILDDAVPGGTYYLFAFTVDERGAQSLPTAEKAVIVQSPVWTAIGQNIIKGLALAMVVITLVAALILLVLYVLRKIHRTRKELRHRFSEAEFIIDTTVEIIKEDMEDCVRILERAHKRRELTKEEQTVMKKLRDTELEMEKAVHKAMLAAEKKAKKD
jgi:hypothetical protein